MEYSNPAKLELII